MKLVLTIEQITFWLHKSSNDNSNTYIWYVLVVYIARKMLNVSNSSSFFSYGLLKGNKKKKKPENDARWTPPTRRLSFLLMSSNVSFWLRHAVHQNRKI